MMNGVLMEGIMSMPLVWKLWVFWMMTVNTASIVFCWKNIEARFILGVWIPNGIMMSFLAEQVGYVRLLGVSHIIWWTPLVAYLIMRRKHLEVGTIYGKWVYTVLITNAASLVVDYIDVIRYLAGERGEVTF